MNGVEYGNRLTHVLKENRHLLIPKNQAKRYEKENEPTIQENDGDGPSRNERMIGAGVTAGAATIIFGPIIALIVGYGTAYGTTRPGAAGDICRAIGDTGLFIRDKAKELNQKHEIIEKTKKGAKETAEMVRNPEERNQLVNKTKNVCSDTWNNLREFENKHGLLEKAKNAIGEALTFIGNKLRKNGAQNDPSNASSAIKGHEMN